MVVGHSSESNRQPFRDQRSTQNRPTRTAPAVVWQLRPSRVQRVMVAVLSMTAVLATAFFCLTQASVFLCLVVALTTLGAVGLAIRGVRVATSGTLDWDGRQWRHNGHVVVALRCVAECPRFVLVCLKADGQVEQWLWLEAPDADCSWRALRRALAHYEQQILYSPLAERRSALN